MNVFNLSLHRSGTQSAHDLLRRAGAASVHWIATVDGIDYQQKAQGRETDLEYVADALRPAFSGFTAIHDFPIPALYRQLCAADKSSLFFALYREPETWIASVRRHIGHRAFVTFEKVVYWSFFSSRPEFISSISDRELRDFHGWHHDSVTDFFAGTNRFLLLKLDQRGVGAALCDFVGLPRQPFRQFDYALGHQHHLDPHLVAAKVTE